MVFQIPFKANVQSPLLIRNSPFRLILISAIVVTTIFLFVLCTDTSLLTKEPRKEYLSLLEEEQQSGEVRNKPHIRKSLLQYLGPVARRLLPWTTSSKPRILAWNPFFTNSDYIPRPGAIGCPVDCDVTSDRSLLDRSDAVVLHWRNIDLEDLPPPDGNQQWVLFNLEAPPHTSTDVLKGVEANIRWTASYRRDSDIFTPYGEVVRRAERHSRQEIREKRNLICWIVSNCDTPSHRKSYVHQLKKHAPVQVYGRCGNLSCPDGNAQNCYRAVSSHCKFYLSFENSLCRDYVTEKLFYVLQTDMVPIVMGGADYARFMPNHSYIDALDYDDPRDLAKYLLKLDADRARYLEYHSWKSDYEIVNSPANALSCGLCKMLHREASKQVATKRTKKRHDLFEWWFDNGTCYSWVQYFNTHLVM